MRVVIAGGGSVGRYMARQLHAVGNDVTVIDQLHALAERYQGLDDIRWQLGDACELDILEAAGVADADVVAAVTGDDEDNLVISLLAKQEFGVPRTVARVNNPNNEWMYNDMWGVDVSVSTPHLLTAVVEEAVNVGSLVRLLSLEGGKAGLAEVTLTETSPAAGRTIQTLGLPRECTIVALIRERHVVVPRGDTVLLVGDEVLVLVSGADADAAVHAILVGG